VGGLPLRWAAEGADHLWLKTLRPDFQNPDAMPIYAYKMRVLRVFQGRAARRVRRPRCRICQLRWWWLPEAADGGRLPATEGSGWYATDFKGGGTSAPASTEAPASGGDAAKPADTGAKPAAAASAPGLRHLLRLPLSRPPTPVHRRHAR